MPVKANQNPREFSKRGPFLFKFGHFPLFLSIKMFKTFRFGRPCLDLEKAIAEWT